MIQLLRRRICRKKIVYHQHHKQNVQHHRNPSLVNKVPENLSLNSQRHFKNQLRLLVLLLTRSLIIRFDFFFICNNKLEFLNSNKQLRKVREKRFDKVDWVKKTYVRCSPNHIIDRGALNCKYNVKSVQTGDVDVAQEIVYHLIIRVEVPWYKEQYLL